MVEGAKWKRVRRVLAWLLSCPLLCAAVRRHLHEPAAARAGAGLALGAQLLEAGRARNVLEELRRRRTRRARRVGRGVAQLRRVLFGGSGTPRSASEGQVVEDELCRQRRSAWRRAWRRAGRQTGGGGRPEA